MLKEPRTLRIYGTGLIYLEGSMSITPDFRNSQLFQNICIVLDTVCPASNLGVWHLFLFLHTALESRSNQEHLWHQGTHRVDKLHSTIKLGKVLVSNSSAHREVFDYAEAQAADLWPVSIILVHVINDYFSNRTGMLISASALT
jgi:hypothetical protein